MSKAQLNLQDMFLNQVRKDNIPVTIYLANSVQLRGMVRGFDPFTVILESAGRPTQLVYKHAIASIVPARPVPGFVGDAIPREARPRESTPATHTAHDEATAGPEEETKDASR